MGFLGSNLSPKSLLADIIPFDYYLSVLARYTVADPKNVIPKKLLQNYKILLLVKASTD